nr:ABC transporter permease [Cohnella sp. CFH 77786]
MILSLAWNDIKTKYAGSYFGVVWAFVQPIMSILVYWYVFQYGLKAMPVDDNVPFAIWFITGLIPWFYFSEALSSATNSFYEYSYLVKKIVFKISILPLVKVISAIFIHIVFVGFLVIIFLLYGYKLNFYALQIIYYSFCMSVLVTGLSFVTSALMVFFKDLGQIISIFLQLGMWTTPIMWSYKIVLPQYQWFIDWNPMFYVVEGYRKSLIYHQSFFTQTTELQRFWLITGIVFLAGLIIFKRLKPHFSEVL